MNQRAAIKNRAVMPSDYKPETWEDVVGNQELKELCLGLIHRVRILGSTEAFKLLVTGVSRGGKTSLIEFVIKVLLCCNLDRESLVPCGKCVNCKNRVYKFGTGDWNGHVAFFDNSENQTPVRFHYHPLDCARAGTQEVEELLNEIRIDDGDLRIVYLDEVHRLSKQSLDERFLIPLEHYKVIWFASSAMVKESSHDSAQKLDKMFQNRFLRVQTEKPDETEMTHWLARRCHQHELNCDDAENVLRLLSRRSNLIPGMALQVLDRACISTNRELTREMVERFPFDLDD